MALGPFFSFLKLTGIITSKLGDLYQVFCKTSCMAVHLALFSSSNFTNLLENLFSMNGNDLFFIKSLCCYCSRCCYFPDIYFVLFLKIKEKRK